MNYDVIIIGGSFAGMSAAMYLARARRSVCILDTGKPRNRFATHSHGFFGMDGSNPKSMLDTARSQLKAYPTVTLINDEAVGAVQEKDRFAVNLSQNQTIHSNRLILAFGISDELPDISGMKERWGQSVLHCPYCHGYEFSDQQLGVLNVHPLSVHQAILVREWGPVTFFLNGSNIDPDSLSKLEAAGVKIEPDPVKALHGPGLQLETIELSTGRNVKMDALYVGTRTHFNSGIADHLGCQTEEGPSGSIIQTDTQMMTTVPGVFAAGDITRGIHSVTWACSDGVLAGVAAHRSLVFEH